MITRLPDSGVFTIKDIALSADSTVTMLGFDGELKTSAVDGGLAVELPRFNPSTLPCQHIFTLKLTSVQ
jgi:hypothetical protein